MNIRPFALAIATLAATVACGGAIAQESRKAAEEIKEAVALAAISRHWSTVLNGMAIDMATFRKEVDTSLRIAAERAAKK